MNAFYKVIVETLTDGAVTATDTRYSASFDEASASCSQVEASFSGLTSAQLKTLFDSLQANAPATPSGKVVEARNCGGSTSQYDIVVLDSNDGLPSSGGGGGGTTTTTGFDTSYAFSKVGFDFGGHALVSTPAPILTAIDQDKPRPYGNNYAFAVNSALNANLFKRIPVFNTGDRIIGYPGRFFTNPEDNDMLLRGFTHLTESVQKKGGVYPVQYKRMLELANYAAAYNAANSLLDGDPRKQVLYDWAGPLPAFEGTHVLINREDAAQLYAKYWYALFKQIDVKGGGVEYFSVNHEVYQARNPDYYYQEWYQHVGWITKAILAEAAADPDNVLKGTGMTDFGNLSHVSPHFFDDNDPATGFPRYMSFNYIHEPYRGSSQSQPIGNGSVMSDLILSGKAFVGVGRYVQHTMDDETMWQKNPDGTIKLDGDGFPLWRVDKRQTVICGQQTVVYKDDYEMAMIKHYGREASDYANWYFRAGSKHLPYSTDRGAGYENLQFSGQYRLDTESDTGNSNLAPGYNGLTQQEFDWLNERPLNPEWTEDNAIRMYLNEKYLRGWMATQAETDLGADPGDGSKARASVEFYQKGFQRAANMSWIDEVGYQLVEPKLWLKNQGIVSGKDPWEHFSRKPIIRLRTTVKDNRRILWVKGKWPCQDTNRTTQGIIWVDKDGVISPGYQFNLNGRWTYLDYFRLPVGFPAFEPKHIRIQFKSLLDEVITWTGDYREPRITSNPTPPALA